MGNNLIYAPFPETRVVCENGKQDDIVYAASTMKGWRRNQEDSSKALLNFHDDLSYFAVFDGHGGSEIAEFLKIQLHNYIKGFLEEGDDVEVALHSGFLSCDVSLRDPATKAVLEGLLEKEGAAARILKSQLLESIATGSGQFTPVTRRTVEATRRNLRSFGQGPRGDGPSITGEDMPNPPGPSGDRRVDSSGGPGENDESSGTSGAVSRPSHVTSGAGDAASGSGAASGASGAASGASGAASGASGAASGASAAASGKKKVFPRRGNTRYGYYIFGRHGTGAGPSREAPESRISLQDSEALQYLLNQDLESTDSEDDDFDVEEEESLSEMSEEDMQVEAEALLKQEPGDFSGSTATVVLISPSKIYVANAGDSRCVLSRNSQAIDLSVDHNPNKPEELQRILNAGASVTADGRVNNLLNLSRAFGDFHLKGSSNIPSEQAITAEPYITSIEIQDDDDFLVIASDGIWNSISSQQLIDFINMRIKTKDCTLNTICDEVFQFIMPTEFNEEGIGCDNMTLMIIKFQARDSSFLVDEACEMMEYKLLSSESDTDIEATPTQEQPSSSTELDETLNFSLAVPTASGDEVHSTSSSNQPMPRQQVPKDQGEIEVVDLDP